MKIRLLDVVSSSVSLMQDSTDQLTASVVSRCCIPNTKMLMPSLWLKSKDRLNKHVCVSMQQCVFVHYLHAKLVAYMHWSKPMHYALQLKNTVLILEI